MDELPRFGVVLGRLEQVLKKALWLSPMAFIALMLTGLTSEAILPKLLYAFVNATSFTNPTLRVQSAPPVMLSRSDIAFLLSATPIESPSKDLPTAIQPTTSRGVLPTWIRI
jgi:hypothetical protein|tara:strand:+ start:581 stop:916 length:336 start_codon:yes stop_codon:yes gene_type:complete